MIGGVTSNIICSPFFKEGEMNGYTDFYLLMRSVRLGPDAIYALANTLANRKEDEYEISLRTKGSRFIREIYASLCNIYELESNQDIDIVEISKEDEGINLFAEQLDEFNMVSLSGAMITGAISKDQISVAIDAQRAVEGILYDKRYIEVGIMLALMYQKLLNSKSNNKKDGILAKKELVRKDLEVICKQPIKNWESYNIAGLGDYSKLSDPYHIVSAMASCIIDSSSYEDAIRKSAACYNHPSFLSFSVGLIAEKIYGIPEDLSNDGYSVLEKSPTLYEILSDFENENPPNIGSKRSVIARTF